MLSQPSPALVLDRQVVQGLEDLQALEFPLDGLVNNYLQIKIAAGSVSLTTMAASKYASVKTNVEALLLNGIGSFLADTTHGSGTHASSALLGHQLTKAFDSYYTLKKNLGEETIDTALMALTKSGKSTVINALTGSQLLPSNNIPETARIVSIEHTGLGSTGKPVLTYKLGNQSIRVEGESEIYCHLEYCNKEVRSRAHRKEDEQVLAIKADIAGLPKGDAEQQCRLRLLDTPGTNEANEDRLRHSVERLLDSVDAVVYILDYTKLKTTEEASLLAKLKEANPQLVQRLAQRLFFVVNKIDSMHSNVGLQEEELCEYVADLITKQMNCPEFQLKPEQVMLVSAQEALLARLVLLNKASEEDKRKFCMKAWGSSWGRRKQTKSEAEMQEQAAQMLEDSRLPELEDRLFSFLYKNAGGLKLVSLLDNMSRLLNEIHNGASTGLAALRQSASQIAKEGEQLQKSLEATLARFDSVQKDADQIEHDVTDNVQARMQTLKEKLFAHVNEVLEGVENPTLPAVRSGPWRKAWEKAVHFLRRSNTETQNDSELREKLHDLHQDIQNQVSSEIHQFWHDLEVATNDKHQQLIGILNVHLDSLARDVEQVVGAALNLRLEPLDIQLDPPNAQQFHKSIQELFDTGIGRNTRTEKESREEEYTVWETRYRGLCRTTEYYVGIPAKRRVEFDKEVTTFQLNSDSIKEYFQNMVNSSVDTSIKHVRAYVHAYLSDNIRAARSKISGYGEMYCDIMQKALDIKSRSFEEQDAGMKSLEAQVQAVTKLLAEASALQEQAAELIAEADPPNGWLLEPSQAQAEEALEGSKPEPLQEQADESVPIEDHEQDQWTASWATLLKELESTHSQGSIDRAEKETRDVASASTDTEGGMGRDVDPDSGEGIKEENQMDEPQKLLKKILGIHKGSSSPELEVEPAMSTPAVAPSSTEDPEMPALSQQPGMETGEDRNGSMPDPNPFAQQQEDAGPSASAQVGQGSTPSAEDAEDSAKKTPWMKLIYGFQNGQVRPPLPLSQSIVHDEGTSSSSAISSPKSKHSNSSMPAGASLHQEDTQMGLPRQDSLDSSEWECLSHEQYLPEAQA